MTKTEEKRLKKLCKLAKDVCVSFMVCGIINDPMTLKEAKKIIKQRVDDCWLDTPKWMKKEVKNYIDGLEIIKVGY